MKTLSLHLMLWIAAVCFSQIPGEAVANSESREYGSGSPAGGPSYHGDHSGSAAGGYHGYTRKPGGYDPKESFEEFSRKLNLTKEQKEKIRPILNQEVDKIKQVYEKARKQEQKILEEHRQKVMGHLTPQQREAYRKMIEERRRSEPAAGDAAAGEVEVPVVITLVVREPVNYYGKSVIVEGYVKKRLTDDAFILSDAPNGAAEVIVVGAGPAVVDDPRAGEKVVVRGVVQSFKIDEMEKALGVDMDEGVFGMLEKKPGIFARWVKKL